MKEAWFNLRSWASGNNHKLTNLAAQNKVDDGYSTSVVYVLDLKWDTQTNTLSLSCKLPMYHCMLPPLSLIKCWENHPRNSTHWEYCQFVTCYKGKVVVAKLLCKSCGIVTFSWMSHWLKMTKRRCWIVAHDIEEAMSVSIPRQAFPGIM